MKTCFNSGREGGILAKMFPKGYESSKHTINCEPFHVIYCRSTWMDVSMFHVLWSGRPTRQERPPMAWRGSPWLGVDCSSLNPPTYDRSRIVEEGKWGGGLHASSLKRDKQIRRWTPNCLTRLCLIHVALTALPPRDRAHKRISKAMHNATVCMHGLRKSDLLWPMYLQLRGIYFFTSKFVICCAWSGLPARIDRGSSVVVQHNAGGKSIRTGQRVSTGQRDLG